MKDNIKVGMADLKVAAEGEVLKTTGLGSCVGLTLFDSASRVAGMAHIMLPSSEISRESAFNRAKYADTALPMLLEAMAERGASMKRIVAKLAGGAQMFVFAGQSDTMRIGPRNVETCKLMLNELAIPLMAEDTGANYGRTIELDSMTGLLTIRSVQYGIKEL
jgi:chemotaxis protein CheD